MHRPSRVRVGDCEEDSPKRSVRKKWVAEDSHHIIVPTIDIDQHLFSHPNVYSHVTNGYANGVKVMGRANGNELHLERCVRRKDDVRNDKVYSEAKKLRRRADLGMRHEKMQLLSTPVRIIHYFNTNC